MMGGTGGARGGSGGNEGRSSGASETGGSAGGSTAPTTLADGGSASDLPPASGATDCASKSPNNILANAGFDTTIWSKFGGARDGEPLPRWDGIDSKNCANSGSLRVSHRTAISDTFPVTAGATYYWGFDVKRPATDTGVGTTECHFTYCGDAACNNLLDYGQFLWPKQIAEEWQHVSGVEVPPSPAVAAYVICYTHGVEAANFDRFFVNPTAPGF
jgi:hypothetical protein